MEIFGPTHAALVLGNVTTARAIFRAVLLTIGAQVDNSIAYEFNGMERWQDAVDVACEKLQAVREVLIKTGSTPMVDWFTSLTLTEAIMGALWRGNVAPESDGITAAEMESLARVVIEACDSLVLECLEAGMPSMNSTQAAGA